MGPASKVQHSVNVGLLNKECSNYYIVHFFFIVKTFINEKGILKTMKKRGQLLGMPFIMIFALVVGALTLAGGLYYVFKLVPMAEQISANKEINDFKTTIKAYYYLEEGNSKKVRLQFPSKAQSICFFDYKKYKAEGWRPGAGTGYPPDFAAKKLFYEKLFSANTERNMFFFPTKDFKESAFYIPYLNLESQANNPVCVKNGQYIRIVSMGDHVEVQAE